MLALALMLNKIETENLTGNQKMETVCLGDGPEWPSQSLDLM